MRRGPNCPSKFHPIIWGDSCGVLVKIVSPNRASMNTCREECCCETWRIVLRKQKKAIDSSRWPKPASSASSIGSRVPRIFHSIASSPHNYMKIDRKRISPIEGSRFDDRFWPRKVVLFLNNYVMLLLLRSHDTFLHIESGRELCGRRVDPPALHQNVPQVFSWSSLH